VGSSIEKRILLEFWTSEEIYRQAMELYAENRILIPNEDGTFWLNSEPKLLVEVTFKNSTDFSVALDLSKGDKAFDDRVRRIEKTLERNEDNGTMTMALVEINHKDNYEEQTDPKSANRIGLALTNRISQFIHPLEMEEKEDTKKARLINSFYDLLSDHGFLPARYLKLKNENLILGFSLIKGKHRENQKDMYLPVVTRMKGSEVKIRLFGGREWFTVWEALLAVCKDQRFIQKPAQYNDEAAKYRSFFERTVSECLREYKDDIVVLLDANLRTLQWKELTNPNLDLNDLPFHINEPECKSRVKVIRVSDEKDVHQYRIRDKNEVNRNQGLFKDAEAKLYYGIGAKPGTIKMSPFLQKYNSPGKFIPHQQIVEYIPLGNMNDEERDELAKLAHHLRKLNIAYNVHTKLPYPLDIMKSVRKYVRTLKDYEYDYDDSFEDWELVGEVSSNLE